ncbi:MAG: UDP-N-acetylmuramoyl-L-alanyl-D-glutamate--2,6-diaminopimelate ligase, partial [Candidatus Eremiobacteraeota bacterium]|nr:UDP-N-acetylmuramoyl-L-alanyl-D-glutamate--2,6-diaminopimelate ligase [Candidatus Eremiobacteraeota bacterium]
VESVREVPGRMVPLQAGDATVYIDYAHTPDGLERVLVAARAAAQERLLCVFGCGGDRDRSKRPLMGAIAAQLADYVIVTTDNPRHEDPDAIIREIVAGMRTGRAEHTVIRDRTSAIQEAIRSAGAGDVVVIAGKGHEAYQIVGDDRIPYSDMQVAQEAIRAIVPCR